MTDIQYSQIKTDDFISRHIGTVRNDQASMLNSIGVESAQELIKKTVPKSIQFKKALNIPKQLSEHEMLSKLKKIGAKNDLFNNFIGLGYYGTITPPAIQRNIVENPAWYTQYTPYQPEISQGRLESLLNFQTMISEICKLEIANASLLDEPTAAAEAMALCNAVRNKDGSKAFFIDQRVLPQTIEVLSGRAQALGVDIIIGDYERFSFDSPVFGCLLQYPAADGGVNNYSDFVEACHKHNGLVVFAADLLSLFLLKAPGELGADIAVGSAQRFGVQMGYGGPHAGFFATREEFKRLVPGRIVGVSKDKAGKTAYRLALQTREQHIRREKATSNICTAQALLANVSAMYAVYHGNDGLRSIAERVHFFASLCARKLQDAGLVLKHSAFFDTISIELESKAQLDAIRKRAQSQKVNLCYLEKLKVSISFDETHSLEDVFTIYEIVSGQNDSDVQRRSLATKCCIPENLRRNGKVLKHQVFSTYHTETKLMRYIRALDKKDLSLTTSMIPLGSCTMKLNAASELLSLSEPNFSQLHPFCPSEQALGYTELIGELGEILCEITGFSAVSMQPNSGAQGEFAGLLTIKAYLKDTGESHRNICIIPSSAHGTNPASAAMAGLKVVVVKCNSNGDIDLDDLKAKVSKYKESIAALMLTYPSTHGVFEENVKEVCEVVHAAGGQIYMDGANLNAQVGLCRPGDYGPDVCHLNLHKTFCIPHGGGGPGMGPIAVAKHLEKYLPGSKVAGVGFDSSIPSISGSPFGSASLLPISWAYCRMMGPVGLKKASEAAILHANYIAKKLEPFYPVLYTGEHGFVAHECVIDIRPLKAKSGIENTDIAKRLIDYGFHAPTMSFPVPGTLMIEPTESEDLAEMDRFIQAMIQIREEISKVESGEWAKDNNPLKNAPHTADSIAMESWKHPYSRAVAIYPASWTKENKFWPSVARVEEAFGDRNFICTCPPIEAYES